MKYSNFFNIVAKNLDLKMFIKDKKFEYKYFHIKTFFIDKKLVIKNVKLKFVH